MYVCMFCYSLDFCQFQFLNFYKIFKEIRMYCKSESEIRNLCLGRFGTGWNIARYWWKKNNPPIFLKGSGECKKRNNGISDRVVSLSLSLDAKNLCTYSMFLCIIFRQSFLQPIITVIRPIKHKECQLHPLHLKKPLGQ